MSDLFHCYRCGATAEPETRPVSASRLAACAPPGWRYQSLPYPEPEIAEVHVTLCSDCVASLADWSRAEAVTTPDEMPDGRPAEEVDRMLVATRLSLEEDEPAYLPEIDALIEAVKAERQGWKAQIYHLRVVLAGLLDDDPCQFDHNEDCQTHQAGPGEGSCFYAAGRDLLGTDEPVLTRSLISGIDEP